MPYLPSLLTLLLLCLVAVGCRSAESGDGAAATTPQPHTGLEWYGLTKEQFIAKAEATDGLRWRIVREDDQNHKVTMDRIPGRLNVELDNGRVSMVRKEAAGILEGTPSPALRPYIGLTLDQAKARAAKESVPFRVGSVDGEERMLTMDFVPERVTVSVVDDIVTTATNG